MNVLDENIPDHQRSALSRARILFRQIGQEVGKTGLNDEEILTLLHQLARPTFFTRDRDFYRRDRCHPGYCLVWLEVKITEVAEYIRRVLQHPQLNTYAKRKGKVLGVKPLGITVWKLHKDNPERLKWPPRKRR